MGKTSYHLRKGILFFLILFAFLMMKSGFAMATAETLYLDRGDDLSLLADGTPKRRFYISNSVGAGTLKIVNNLNFDRADLKCNGEKTKSLNFSNYRHQGRKRIKKHKAAVDIIISKSVKNCILEFSPEKKVLLIKDELAFPFLKKMNRVHEKCNFAQSELNASGKVFYTNSFPMMGCVHHLDKIKLLPKSEDGLLMKMEALLGYRPDKSFVDNLNPYAELDFSKAPKLDAIYVSTLLYRHDFTGTVLARLLEYHAKRGTLVNIIGTGYMHTDEDKILLKRLSKTSPNIRIQEYKYHEAKFLKKAHFLTNYLRDMHVKAFVALSFKHPEYDRVIIGGRNIHDGFIFTKRPALESFPELDQVAAGESYAYWQDLEVQIRSQEFTESLYAQLLSFWNRRINGQKMRSFSSAQGQRPKLVSGDDNGEVLARHIISLPFNDDHALEKLYVEMINSAQTSIKISSPYLRPTKAIMQAIFNALKRNPKMDIVIQSRIKLTGDTQAWLYEETNKAAINKLYQKVRLFEWKQNSILHAKLLVIDNEYVFMGSVNLSRRSFIQDVENGLYLKNHDFAQEISSLIDHYNSLSKRITEKQARSFWAGVVVKILENQF